MNGVKRLKIIFIFVQFFTQFLVSFFPLYFKFLYRSKVYVLCAYSFSSGVFLSIAIIHLLEHAQEGFVDKLDTEKPLGYVVAITGFIFIMCLENFPLAYIEYQKVISN
jgi:hypothetical protein